MRVVLLIFFLVLLGCNKDSEILQIEKEYKVESRALECNTPTNLTATNITATTAAVKWDKQSTASKYRI